VWEVGTSRDGNISRVLHPLSPRPISICVDAKGALWVANAS
jgi:hypothetical protein